MSNDGYDPYMVQKQAQAAHAAPQPTAAHRQQPNTCVVFSRSYPYPLGEYRPNAHEGNRFTSAQSDLWQFSQCPNILQASTKAQVD